MRPISRPSVPLLGLVQGVDCGMDVEVAGARVGHNGNNSAVCLVRHAIGWSHEEVVIASPFVLPAIFEKTTSHLWRTFVGLVGCCAALLLLPGE